MAFLYLAISFAVAYLDRSRLKISCTVSGFILNSSASLLKDHSFGLSIRFLTILLFLIVFGSMYAYYHNYE